ncbi:hypothetical protein AB870_04605 [Pandoraea faecigallinarum]|uniref:BIG2 domain-containing protein n=1 Tax=Pandoraea faecigallinarum TaxID=656179 RepID=A0A0H3WPT4_9BURK|nr:Ig-like domain-containing protein [Pandoraea faecigallinarum]AKM29570.1 hypothetical protein AB870_04605 [Pandoraea faecigallinarum]
MNTRDSFFLRAPDKLEETLVLQAPQVPLAEANGGIRKQEVYADLEGYLDVLVPWNPLMLKGDTLRLYWGRVGHIVDLMIVESPNDPNFQMKVPVKDVIDVGDGIVDVWYERISSFGDPAPAPSPITSVLVKLSVPGGDDPDQSTWPVNEGLEKAILPPGPIDAVPPEGIRVEIPPWLNMTAGDRLKLFWGAATWEVPPIDESQVDKPLILMVPAAVIEAGGDGEAVAVTYEIRDTVSNWSGRALSSFIEVEMGDAIYDPPAVVEVSNDVLDYDLLDGADAQVIIMKNGDMEQGDGVILVFEGRSYEGLEVTYTASQTLGGGVILSFDLPNATLAQIVPGQGSLYYRVSTAGGVHKGRSYRSNFAVEGTAVLLPAPRVLEASDDATLDPADVPNGATVDVEPWPNLALGDLLRLRWEGTTQGGDPVTYFDIIEISRENVGEPLRFTVPYSKIGPLGGGTVNVMYTVQSGTSLRESSTLTLTVFKADALPAPLVEGEVNGELNPIFVPAGARVTIPAWPDMAVGDSVTWFWLGTSEGGQQTGTEQVTAVGDIVVVADRNVIEINAMGGDTVNVLYEVTHASGGKTGSMAKTFVVLPLETTLPAPIVVEAVDGILDPSELEIDATVRVAPYEGMARNDVVKIRFGENTAGEHIQSFAITDNMVGNPVNMYVPRDKILALNNRMVAVYYTVTNADGEQTSKELLIEIHEAEIWPAPHVEEADGDFLPEDAYLRGATTVVPEFRDMRPGDEIDLYWGEGSREYHDSIGIVTPMDYPFRVEKDVIDRWHGEIVPVRYTITRGNRVFKSEVLNLRVALPLPGLSAPEVLEATGNVLKPVDAKQGATVSVTYEDMSPEDSIQLSWDGDTSFPAVPGDPSGTVTFTVPPDKVAMCLGRTVPVSFVVTRKGIDVESPVLDLVVENFLPGNLPLATVVEQKGGVLNLSNFAGDATARQPAWPLMAQGQRIWWRLHGTQISGSRITITLESGHVVTAEEAGKPLNRTLRRVDLEKLQDGSNFTLEVKVTFDGSPNEADAVVFRVRTLRFSDGLDLFAPEVTEAQDGELDAIDAIDGVTVRVTYEDMQATDSIQLVWDGDASFDTVAGDASGTVDIPVDADKVLPYIGKTLPVYYTVTRNGQTTASGILDLTINDFAAGDLPTPVIPQAANGQLKLSSFTGNAAVTVKQWPAIAADQKFWLRCHGTLASGASDTIVLAEGVGVTAAEVDAGINRALPRARLEALRNGSNLRVEMKVTFDGSSNEANAIPFPELTVKMEVIPDFTLPDTQMVLNGLAIKTGWPKTGEDAPGNAQTRAATGGVPPYTYTSSKPSVASVNAQGKVVGERNGTATITVKDSRGTSKSYTVVVSNVFQFIIWDVPGLSIQQAISWANSVGRGIGDAEIAVLRKVYSRGVRPESFFYWASSQAGCGSNYGRQMGWDTITLSGCVLSNPGVGPGHGAFAKAAALTPLNG